MIAITTRSSTSVNALRDAVPHRHQPAQDLAIASPFARLTCSVDATIPLMCVCLSHHESSAMRAATYHTLVGITRVDNTRLASVVLQWKESDILSRWKMRRPERIERRLCAVYFSGWGVRGGERSRRSRKPAANTPRWGCFGEIFFNLCGEGPFFAFHPPLRSLGAWLY
jgi:hypothetical protein